MTYKKLMRTMRDECHKNGNGCLNEEQRLKLGVFDKCFPVGGMGDIDGAYEWRGKLLLMEWKP